MVNRYILSLNKEQKNIRLPVKAYDTNHAQAQAQDIVRALEGDELELSYGFIKENLLSKLFEQLAFNEFNFASCTKWEGKFSNNCACVYVFSRRYYIRDITLKYLNIPKDTTTAKCGCKNNTCINPYHFEYHDAKNSKLTGGDLKMLVAYRSQGTGVSQIAEAFKVHRSTIYRKLKNECVSFGASNYGGSSGKRRQD